VRAHELDGFSGILANGKEKRPQLFEGKIEPADLCQGAVGDCWLVAAFACAAEFEDCIRAQFVTKEYNANGRYQVTHTQREREREREREYIYSDYCIESV
jgi:hypothetical protein